jgi:hypothetical protein
MTPREKAEELYVKFSHTALSHIEGKKCALIAVDEILNIDDNMTVAALKYWQQVKQEIQSL